MNKQEFVDRLRMALNGRVSPGLVMDNVNYYEDYINTEIRKGRTEEEVLESLGDPRLIARTIIQTNGGDNRLRGFVFHFRKVLEILSGPYIYAVHMSC